MILIGYLIVHVVVNAQSYQKVPFITIVFCWIQQILLLIFN